MTNDDIAERLRSLELAVRELAVTHTGCQKYCNEVISKIGTTIYGNGKPGLVVDSRENTTAINALAAELRTYKRIVGSVGLAVLTLFFDFVKRKIL